MANMSEAQGSHGSAVEPLRAKCGWIIALGVVYIIVGLIALSSVAFATTVSVFLVGIMMMVAGVTEVINAFQFKSWAKFILWILLGVFYVVAGFLALENPLLTAALLTLMLGCFLIASGVMRVILAFSMKVGTSWFLVVLSGLITLLVGGVIVAHWPVSSPYLLGIFLGFDLLFTGFGWLMIGLGLRSRA
jgi:uncharacterized membrane protein HdeD (DUF308 family)